MATAPVYPSGPFVLNATATGANAAAEVTFVSDAQITYLVGSAPNTASVTLSLSDSNGSNYVNVGSGGGAPATFSLSAVFDGNALTAYVNGTETPGGLPYHVKAGCKMKLTRDATSDAVTLHVSGLYYA